MTPNPSATLRRVEDMIAIALRTWGVGRVEAAGLEAMQADLALARGETEQLEELVAHSPPLEGELVAHERTPLMRHPHVERGQG